MNFVRGLQLCLVLLLAALAFAIVTDDAGV